MFSLFFLMKKFCVSAEPFCDLLWKTDSLSSISDKSVIQTAKYSFFNQSSVNESFYGTLLN